mmetsp:Transcript_60460/g.142638  ORF Transcript_60460/g.142638 Transcript_60460/m.142638 type:complete len:247 (-) Transcript_60460:2184-2924(-)
MIDPLSTGPASTRPGHEHRPPSTAETTVNVLTTLGLFSHLKQRLYSQFKFPHLIRLTPTPNPLGLFVLRQIDDAEALGEPRASGASWGAPPRAAPPSRARSPSPDPPASSESIRRDQAPGILWHPRSRRPRAGTPPPARALAARRGASQSGLASSWPRCWRRGRGAASRTPAGPPRPRGSGAWRGPRSACRPLRRRPGPLSARPHPRCDKRRRPGTTPWAWRRWRCSLWTRGSRRACGRGSRCASA